MPLVTVIIPTYNHRNTVQATLDSVFAQTFHDYEVVVVNDGSPDDTEAVLAPLIATGRIRYVDQPNSGVATARNVGLSIAQGAWIAYLDDDDLWPSDKLEWQVRAALADDGAALIYGYVEPFGETLDWPTDREAPSGQVLHAFLSRNYILSPGQTLIRASALRALGGFDTRFWGTDDYDIYLSLAARHRFVYLRQCALLYRSHRGNASRDLWRMYVNARRVQRKHLGWIPFPGRLRMWLAARPCTQEMRRHVGRKLLEAARSSAAAGDKRSARRHLARAVFARRTLLRRWEVIAGLLGFPRSG